MVFGFGGSQKHVGKARPSPEAMTLEDHIALETAPKLRDVAGKVWNAPNTALGLAYGLAGYGVGQLNRLRPGDQPNDPRIQFGHNAVEFVNNPLTRGAITLGNTISYEGDPYDPEDAGWAEYKRRYGQDVRDHEEKHTYQGQQLGPAYLPSNILGGAAGLVFDRNWHGDHNWNERGPQMNPPQPWPPRRRP
jgi:hypothetical protein